MAYWAKNHVAILTQGRTLNDLDLSKPNLTEANTLKASES